MPDTEVRQVSLKLKLRGDPPLLDSIYFSCPPDTDKVTDLQNRDLPCAVATALLLFRSHTLLTLFRIRTTKPTGALVHKILNAKSQMRGTSCIRDLANGAFLRLFLKPRTLASSYFDIDVTRLRPDAIQVTHDGSIVDDPEVLRQMANDIATQAGWNINDYSVEIAPRERPSSETAASEQQNPSATNEAPTRRTASSTVLDNPAFIAIREAVRNFCQDGVHEYLHVGHIRSQAELEDLWEIDNAAYGEASITYEKFHDWWFSYPSGLHALFFRTPVMGAIGIWPLSAHSAGLLTTGRLKESQLNGRAMRTFINSSTQFWYISGIVLRSELIGGRAIKILLSHGVGSWLASAHIRFPCELFALAYSEQGQSLLEGFDFFKLQNAKAMPDKVPLFALQVSDRDQLLLSLKSRGLDPCPPASKPSN
jgi:hypothetical protein